MILIDVRDADSELIVLVSQLLRSPPLRPVTALQSLPFDNLLSLLQKPEIAVHARMSRLAQGGRCASRRFRTETCFFTAAIVKLANLRFWSAQRSHTTAKTTVGCFKSLAIEGESCSLFF